MRQLPLPLPSGRFRQGGFTFLALIIFIAIMGIATAASLQVGAVLQRRVAEQELLFIGAEFRSALISYANATPTGQRRVPQSLNDLLKDPRYPNAKRHLRKLYYDPLTGNSEWGIVAAPDGGGVLGVYSLSKDTPIKIGNFDMVFQDFAGKTSYQDWRFMATNSLPGGVISRSQPSPPGGAGTR